MKLTQYNNIMILYKLFIKFSLYILKNITLQYSRNALQYNIVCTFRRVSLMKQYYHKFSCHWSSFRCDNLYGSYYGIDSTTREHATFQTRKLVIITSRRTLYKYPAWRSVSLIHWRIVISPKLQSSCETMIKPCMLIVLRRRLLVKSYYFREIYATWKRITFNNILTLLICRFLLFSFISSRINFYVKIRIEYYFLTHHIYHYMKQTTIIFY